MATHAEKVHKIDQNNTKWESIPNATDHLRWYQNKGQIHLNFIISILYVGQALNGYDGTILGSLQALSLWKEDLGHPSASRIGLLNAMSYIAGILITPFATWLLDSWGRKWAMRYYAVTMLIGTVLGCIAGKVGQNGGYALFCVSKFIIGGGLATGLMTMQVCSQLDGASVINFYYSVVFTQLGLTGSTLLTGIAAGLSMFGFVVGLIGVWSMGRVGRRRMVLCTWPVILVFNISLTICGAIYAKSGETNRAAGLASVFFVWAYSGADSYAGPVFYSYPAEILTYLLRAKGMGIWNYTNQAAGLYGAYVNSIGLAALGWKYYIVYAVLLVIQWIALWFFMVETKGATLEEIAIAFEGQDAAVARIDAQLEVGVVKHTVGDGEKDKEFL
ncbi:hypothetical protein RQP46_000668 [Phenoliferia psychrophenolica]